jgi:hypothetical protein
MPQADRHASLLSSSAVVKEGYLNAAQHEGAKEGVELGDDLTALLLRCVCLIVVPLPNVAEVKPRLKVGEVAKHIGKDEVKQRPQLSEIVLQRSACTI